MSNETYDFSELVEDRHVEAYQELSRDQLLYLAGKRFGDLRDVVDLDTVEIAQELAFADVTDRDQ